MTDFDLTQFGILMGQLVTEYRSTFAWMAIVPHIFFGIILLDTEAWKSVSQSLHHLLHSELRLGRDFRRWLA